MLMGDGPLLPVSDYGNLHIKIEQDGMDVVQTCELILKQAVHVPGQRHHLSSAAHLSVMFEHRM